MAVEIVINWLVRLPVVGNVSYLEVLKVIEDWEYSWRGDFKSTGRQKIPIHLAFDPLLTKNRPEA